MSGQPPPNMQPRMHVQYIPPNQPGGMPPGMMNQPRMVGQSRQMTLPAITPENVFHVVQRIPPLLDQIKGMDKYAAAAHVKKVIEKKRTVAPPVQGNMQMRPMGNVMQRPPYGGNPQNNFVPGMMPPGNMSPFPAGQPPPQSLGNNQQMQSMPPQMVPFPGPGPTAQVPSTINPRTPQQPGSNQPVMQGQPHSNQFRNPGSVQQPGSVPNQIRNPNSVPQPGSHPNQFRNPNSVQPPGSHPNQFRNPGSVQQPGSVPNQIRNSNSVQQPGLIQNQLRNANNVQPPGLHPNQIRHPNNVQRAREQQPNPGQAISPLMSNQMTESSGNPSPPQQQPLQPQQLPPQQQQRPPAQQPQQPSPPQLASVESDPEEYAVALKELTDQREKILLLLDKMKCDNDNNYFKLIKIFDIMDGIRKVPLNNLRRLLRSIDMMYCKYDIGSEVHQLVHEIKNTKVIKFPSSIQLYAQYEKERIIPPAKYYAESRYLSNANMRQIYAKRKLRWFWENNFWKDEESERYPYTSVVYNDVESAAHLDRVNAKFNESYGAFVFGHREPTKVKISPEINFLTRLDKLVDCCEDGTELYNEKPLYQEYEVHPNETGVQFDSQGNLIKTIPSKDKYIEPGEPTNKKRRIDVDEGEAVSKNKTGVIEINPDSYVRPVLDPVKSHKTLDRECRFNCCMPFRIPSVQGKPIELPQAAATELRRLRHRPDNEFQPLSEHAVVSTVIVNVAKVNDKMPCPELRMIIHKEYPVRQATYEVLEPNPLNNALIKKFYAAINDKMLERRKCDVRLHTITEITSAFRFCVQSIFSKREFADGFGRCV